MNYYIDFDNTLYNTSLLLERILYAIAEEICSLDINLNIEDIYLEITSLGTEYIYEIIKKILTKYNCDIEKLVTKVNNVILNGNDIVFEDAIIFLKRLKENGHKVYLLTYNQEDLEYQMLKIQGAKIASYFDALYFTSSPKYELDINYSNGIFLDDNPRNLLGLYSKKPKDVIRIRRKGNKYSNEIIDNLDIKEYANLSEIKV